MGRNCGFTLVEAVVSAALLTIISAGFMILFGGNVQILSRIHQIERSGYELGRMIDNHKGSKTNILENLIFEDSEHQISGTLKLYEYKVTKDGNVMYYYQDK